MARSASGLSATLADLDLSGEEAAYVRTHERRYAELLDGLGGCLRHGGASELRLLDIGPGPLTVLIRDAFPDARVDSLGYANPHAPPREGESHVELDLGQVSDPEARPALGPYDGVVFAEVLEHLAVSPLDVFGCFTGWLAPGGVIAVQTPNALALHKRFRALVGRNPLGSAGGVSVGRNSAAHFREYTVAEIVELAEAVGLEPVAVTTRNYFRGGGRARQAYDHLTGLLPAGTRQGITAYLRRR